ncbi:MULTISPECIES: nucleotide exchange factor GrpE [Prauserella salsuginis group]|uniref:Protein GrpE n=2 Tax=Prauserella salsuginis group TaxID=2893672 RepID=A0A839XM51_9PSEU|nr:MULTISPECIES: nucleotide exchange factor GrpE [Prauserella salsuginis group]MBB3662909.1 molecular chaperone GrpE [Prauserella sediminis]MCR3721355.1 molecular chaperone GrpE [Prauserella flava]MCR3734565.1 molecular chaperone GrpE [Prauserella salsuginis]
MTERDETEVREEEPVVVRDRRKVDPESGDLRAPEDGEAVEVPAGELAGTEIGGAAGDAGQAASDVDSDLAKQLEERTADLQRVQAEYANYRRRADREREQLAASGKASLAGDLLPLLDDVERAAQHGDLTGAFKSVADKLVEALEKAGLEPFGAEGDEFDPSVHEAVQHDTSPEVSGPTVTTVLRRGYRFGDRVLREALVAVTDHEPGEAPAEPAVPAADAPPASAEASDAEAPIDPPVEGELPIDGDEQRN